MSFWLSTDPQPSVSLSASIGSTPWDCDRRAIPPPRVRAARATPPLWRTSALPLRRPPGQHRQCDSAHAGGDAKAKQGKSPELHGAICRIAKADQHIHHVPLHGQCADHSEERRHDRSGQPEQPLHETQDTAPAPLGLQSQALNTPAGPCSRERGWTVDVRQSTQIARKNEARARQLGRGELACLVIPSYTRLHEDGNLSTR